MVEGRRGIVFAVLVAMLALVGIYLTMWPSSGGGGQEPAAEPAGVSRTTRGEAEPPHAEATASNAPFDVYSYLPMTKQELAAAADYARRFTAEYGTFSYDEQPSAYGDRLRSYTTSEFADVLLRTVTSPGTVAANTADQVVSVGAAKVKEIRQIQRSSVIFVVTGTQTVTAKSGAKERTADYAVTVVELGTEWRIHDLQPADEGQDGDDQSSGAVG
ncbi:conjugal transfer protein [Streptosporangium saharense]|uniref:conjugal transfer protein n=1 Tax=Streptosporangium saharense TaxID=1706840 RepID=UPI00332236EC